MKKTENFTGNDLIKMGFPPAKWYREALDYINENSLTKIEIENYLEQFRLPEQIELFENQETNRHEEFHLLDFEVLLDLGHVSPF